MTAPGIALKPQAVAQAQPLLLGEQTAGSLLRNILWVFRRHFWVLQLCGVLPVLPLLALVVLLSKWESNWAALPLMGYFFAIFFSSAALTVAISDICLGNRPTVRHSFGRALSKGRWWCLVTSPLLLALGLFVGLLLLVLPGLWLMMHTLLLSTVVTLEQRGPWDAMRRTIQLMRGQSWRIGGLLFLVLLLAYIGIFLLGVLGGFLLAVPALWLGMDNELATATVTMVMGAFGFAVMAPVFGITLVLLYYDQRVRREAYDASALSEDLMR